MGPDGVVTVGLTGALSDGAWGWLDDVVLERIQEAAPDLTLMYVYRKVDPARRPSWANSGPQTLVHVGTGHGWIRSLDQASLPAEVCGPGWAVQTDLTVGLAPGDVPTTIDRATWTNVLGWGTTVQAARHHSLEYHLGGPVPACPK